MTAFKVVIPARYASTRLPGKPLLPLAGKPMILHVCDRARDSGAGEIIVATDHEAIRDCVEAYGISAVITSADHKNGTERIAELCRLRAWNDRDIVVNLQGDEPLLPGALVRALARALAQESGSGAQVATLATSIERVEEVFDPNLVKVVVDRNGHALYFSRAAIPWDRDRFGRETQGIELRTLYQRHIGLYAYSVGFLNRYGNWPITAIEQVESLEQLRILWHGEPILVIRVDSAPPAGVDTREDLQRVERSLQEHHGEFGGAL